MRQGELQGKIIDFPGSPNQRLQVAMNSYAREDYAAALPRFLALIDEGCSDAYVFVGSIYEMGCGGVNQDLEKASFYYQKSVEEFGAVEAYLALARFYYFGKGVDQDYKKALDYYSIVDEESHHPVAALMLGRMHQYGHGVEKDMVKAKAYYETTANKGYVMGLTYLGQLEQETGKYFRGLLLRIKAGILAFRIGRRDIHDSRFRRW